MGDFVTPDLLGNIETQMIGNSIQQQFLGLFNWPFGAALGVVFLLLFALVYWFLQRRGAERA